MKILALLSFFIISFSFFSCGSSADNTLKESSEIVFDFYYSVRERVQYFESNDNEYVVFDDVRINDRAFVCDLDANRIYTLPIDSLITKEKVRFTTIYASHIDTLILLSEYTNKVIMIDSTGRIIRKKDFSPLLLQGAEMHYPINYSKGRFRSGISYYLNTKFNTMEDFWNYKKREISFYNMLNDDCFFEDNKEVLQLDSLFCRFTDETKDVVSGIYITMLDSLNIFYTAFSDSLYVFDMQDNIMRIIPMKSKYTDVKIEPVTYEQYWEDMDAHNRKFRENGFMSELYRDKYRNVYYCFIRGAMEGRKMPFSIIILDEDFNVLDEVKMNHDKYIPSGFVGKEGLYIRNVIGDNLKETKFTLFKYE